jgi:non-homologous end joining protein Ku
LYTDEYKEALTELIENNIEQAKIKRENIKEQKAK